MRLAVFDTHSYDRHSLDEANQAFLTDTALHNIAETTLSNISIIDAGEIPPTCVTRTLALPPRT